jgi:hypothetical protein
MSQDNKVIAYASADELARLMQETGLISVHESTISEGHPVLHASLKVVHAETGAELPGGLPFSVVLFKGAREPGCSNVAIGTVVPAAELDIALTADFFNICNQRYRFVRVFPLDSTSFVLQMDLFVRNATREYIKFSFGLWAAMFSQVLFELVGRGGHSMSRAVDAFAATPSNILSRYVDAIAAEPPAEQNPVEDIAAEPEEESIIAAPAHEAEVDAEPVKAVGEDAGHEEPAQDADEVDDVKEVDLERKLADITAVTDEEADTSEKADDLGKLDAPAAQTAAATDKAEPALV